MSCTCISSMQDSHNLGAQAISFTKFQQLLVASIKGNDDRHNGDAATDKRRSKTDYRKYRCGIRNRYICLLDEKAVSYIAHMVHIYSNCVLYT